mmetsp:Transcript_125439/g.250342  ORF Transcript_125439/g.250342 Transcript_125439/m.250342 type:complete len:413 (+) Transcript_125439:68-1306(+)
MASTTAEAAAGEDLSVEQSPSPPEPEVLTTQTVTGYARKVLGSLGDDSPINVTSEISAEEIRGGNLNYAFCVKDVAGSSCFVKQAPDFIKILGKDGPKLHRERMELEVKYYQECTAVLEATANEYLPKIHNFDADQMVFIMDFLTDYELMQATLNAGTHTPVHSEKLGTVLGSLHAKTHCSRVSKEVAEKFTVDFKNEALRGVQLEYVYSKAFRENEIPIDGRPAREFAKTVQGNEAFATEMEKLKSLYNGEDTMDLALCHGDLHPGSVMVCPQSPFSIKIIDPEFAVYGPPGLDVGSLLSGYILAFSREMQQGGTGTVQRECATQLWTSYARAVKEGGLSDPQVEKIGQDAVGFACAEAGRTCLGFAGERAIALHDNESRIKAEAACFALCVKCLTGREGGISLLLQAMEG